MVEKVLSEKQDLDIGQFHIDYLHFPLRRREQLVNITPLHGRLDIPDLAPLYAVFRDMPVVSISDSHREPLPWVNWQGTVDHGMPDNRLTFGPAPAKYLAFLVRIPPSKAPHYPIQPPIILSLP